MVDTAIVFPGQGSQRLGMLNDYYIHFNEVKETFMEANEALGFNLWNIIQNNEIQLNQTEYTQPALLAGSIAIWRILKKEYTSIVPKVFAGHSLGEYSALCAAEGICFSDALRLVQLRGKLMQSAVTDKQCAMSVILALTNEEVIECCEEAKWAGIVEPANFNTYGQVVISGELKAIKEANIIAKKMGAKRTHLLPISVPSHCSLMKNIAENFTYELECIKIKKPAISIIQNYDANFHENTKPFLVKQLYSPVKWTQTVEKMVKIGIERVIECGANKVLTGLNKRISKTLKCQDTANIDSFRDLLQ